EIEKLHAAIDSSKLDDQRKQNILLGIDYLQRGRGWHGAQLGNDFHLALLSTVHDRSEEYAFKKVILKEFGEASQKYLLFQDKKDNSSGQNFYVLLDKMAIDFNTIPEFNTLYPNVFAANDGKTSQEKEVFEQVRAASFEKIANYFWDLKNNVHTDANMSIFFKSYEKTISEFMSAVEEKSSKNVVDLEDTNNPYFNLICFYEDAVTQGEGSPLSMPLGIQVPLGRCLYGLEVGVYDAIAKSEVLQFEFPISASRRHSESIAEQQK
ncbi:hypothetical protein, partial [Holospora undulata]|uniref:hypothetical protein n=1 Tax=Holospora undulata TaxID=1169117 RepID=UPI00032F4CFB